MRHDRPVDTEESLDEKADLYARLRDISKGQVAFPFSCARFLAKGRNLCFYTQAFFGGLGLHRKGPEYWFFLMRWYVVFLCPPLRSLTRHSTPRQKAPEGV